MTWATARPQRAPTRARCCAPVFAGRRVLPLCLAPVHAAGCSLSGSCCVSQHPSVAMPVAVCSRAAARKLGPDMHQATST